MPKTPHHILPIWGLGGRGWGASYKTTNNQKPVLFPLLIPPLGG